MEIAFRGRDDVTVDLAATVSPRWPGSALFADLASASDFFADGGAGYSATHRADRLDGVDLHTDSWRVQPAVVTRVASSFYDDPRIFPPGSLDLDAALLMRQVPVTWHGRPSLVLGERRHAGHPLG